MIQVPRRGAPGARAGQPPRGLSTARRLPPDVSVTTTLSPIRTAMTLRRLALRLPLLALAALSAACSDLLTPTGTVVEDDSLAVLQVEAGAPDVEAQEVSFYAKRGEDREVQIRYIYPDGAGGATYSKCLLFRVPAQALQTYPDGRPVAQGDSVLITIRLPDKSLYRFEFAPAGLKFDPSNPAQLEVRYRYAERDLNGDGVVDQQDEALLSRVSWWRQETPGAAWELIPTARLTGLLEARAAVTGFTRYALASN